MTLNSCFMLLSSSRRPFLAHLFSVFVTLILLVLFIFLMLYVIISESDTVTFPESIISGHQELVELEKYTLDTDETKKEKSIQLQKNHSYVSQSAVALRCRVMPPPCLKNPYLRNSLEMDIDPFGNQRSKCAGAFSLVNF